MTSLWFSQSLFIFSEFFTESWFSRNWIKAKFQTQGLSITLYKLTYNWLAHSFNELNCQQKIQAFTAFLHSLVKWRKQRVWTKRGTYIQNKVPRRTQISWRGPIWEQYKCWKPFLGVYLQLISLLSRLWPEEGTGQDGGAGPKFLQGKICHRFVNLLWFFSTFLPLAVNQHLIAACQCQNKSLAHFLLQIIAFF